MKLTRLSANLSVFLLSASTLAGAQAKLPAAKTDPKAATAAKPDPKGAVPGKADAKPAAGDKGAVKAPVAGAPPPPAPVPPGTKPADPSAPPAFVKPSRALSAITALAYSNDGKKLAIGSFGQVQVLDTTTWKELACFRQVDDSVRSLAFHPDNETLAIGSGLPGRTGKTTLWNSTGAGKPMVFPNQYDVIESVAFRKDGKSLLIGADDNKVRYVADTGGNGGQVLDSHNGRVQAVAFSPKDDFIFVTGAMDRIVKVWDLKSVRNVINFDQSEAGITGLAFLNNGVQFVGSSLDGRLYWWGVNYNDKKNEFGGYHFRTVGAHDGGVYSLSRSADGNRIITGGADHSAIVWDINNGNQIRKFKDATTQPIYSTALSPDGKIAVAGGREGLVFIWDVEGAKLINTLVPPPVPVAAEPRTAASAASSGNASRPKRRKR